MERLTKHQNYKGDEPIDRSLYGVSVPDTWHLNIYLARVISNGLKMLLDNASCVHDNDTIELVAAKLDFYATDTDVVIHDNIDWSQDDERSDDILVDENGRWISPVGNPGFDEYYEKTTVADAMRHQYAREALTWLAENFGALWD